MNLVELLKSYEGVNPFDSVRKAHQLAQDLQELADANPRWRFIVWLIERAVMKRGMVFPDDLRAFLETLGLRTYEDLETWVNLVNGNELLEVINPTFELTKADVYGVDEIKQIIKDQVNAESSLNFKFRDTMYYPFTERDLRKVLDLSPINKRRYVPEAHDCDDFASELKAWLSSKGYGNMALAYIEVNRYSGGTRVGAHALNLAVLTGRRAVFIEPQTDKIYDPKDSSVWGAWDVQKVRYVEF